MAMNLDHELNQEEQPKDEALDKCGECGGEVGSVHKCPVCNKNMHGFCGIGIGEEGFGQLRRCTKHDNDEEDDEDEPSVDVIGGDYEDNSDENDEVGQKEPDQIPMKLEDAPTEKVFKRKHDEVYDQFDISDGIGKDVGKHVCICKSCRKVVQTSKVFFPEIIIHMN